MVAGDPVRLRRILVNPVGSAIRFTGRGEVVITCTAAAHATRGGPTLTVEDRPTPARLQELGCDMVQGWGPCRPLMLESLQHWMVSSPLAA